MSKIVSKANTPEFNDNYDGIFNPPMVTNYEKPIDKTKQDRLAKLNQSALIMQRHKHRNNRF